MQAYGKKKGRHKLPGHADCGVCMYRREDDKKVKTNKKRARKEGRKQCKSS